MVLLLLLFTDRCATISRDNNLVSIIDVFSSVITRLACLLCSLQPFLTSVPNLNQNIDSCIIVGQFFTRQFLYSRDIYIYPSLPFQLVVRPLQVN